MSKQQVINYKKGNAKYMRKWRAGKKQKEKEKLARERGLAAAIAQLQISHLNDFRKRLFPTLEHFKYHMSSSRQRHRPSTPLPLLTGSTPSTIHPLPVPSMGEIPHPQPVLSMDENADVEWGSPDFPTTCTSNGDLPLSRVNCMQNGRGNVPTMDEIPPVISMGETTDIGSCLRTSVANSNDGRHVKVETTPEVVSLEVPDSVQQDALQVIDSDHSCDKAHGHLAPDACLSTSNEDRLVVSDNFTSRVHEQEAQMAVDSDHGCHKENAVTMLT